VWLQSSLHPDSGGSSVRLKSLNLSVGSVSRRQSVRSDRIPKVYPTVRFGAGMARCDLAHKVFDSQVQKGIQVGKLPDWTCVGGKVVYRVLKGSYEQLPDAWSSFASEAMSVAGSPSRGPPGDVYLCTVMDHPKDPAKLLTILYVPVE
jgi:hypothetical protein